MSRRMILQSITSGVEDRVPVLVITYRVEHEHAGRDGTTAFQDVVITQGLNEGAIARMNLADMEAQPTPAEALDKLADWLDRMAIAIRGREVKATLDIYK